MVGGNENKSFDELKSVEKYDHHLDKWTFLADMQIERRNAEVITKGNKLFVISDYYSDSTCEVYDSFSKKFFYIAQLWNISINPVIFGNYIVVYSRDRELNMILIGISGQIDII